ncbi:DUF3152 domain-containing protein [Streptomyces sp. 21So2-11]|uniref:DUF3152 domain-containing protein n=1 Tax=Streptomyces sp. 21So2-11 TaxID=3144408 RepID=UPI00321936A7
MGRHSRRGPAPKGGVEASGIPPERVAPERVTQERVAAARPETDQGRRTRPTADGQGTWQDARAVPQQQYEQYDQRRGSHSGPGTPAQGAPQARGGHPEQREPGGGWGESAGRHGDWSGVPRATPFGGGPRIPGPRQEFMEAFDAPRTMTGPVATGTATAAAAAGTATQDPFASVTDWDRRGPAAHAVTDWDRRGTPDVQVNGLAADANADGDGDGDGVDGEYADEAPAKGGKGRTFTGIAAAAVTTVLAVVVAGQVAQGEKAQVAAPAAGEQRSTEDSDASRAGKSERTPPKEAVAAPATYEQKMAVPLPLDPKLRMKGDFEAVGGFQQAPGKGQKFSYRVDVEKGLGFDNALFAEAVQKTLNDDRSWAHNGAMTFERVSTGRPDFVITLASPGTTGEWCAKSGLDTTIDNVSCDSAATDRVMINAFRWAQGAETFGKDRMFEYRQMLINHEVGHRLGHGHVSCRTPGALAPIMQQQTKTLDLEGVKCKPNPWAHPGS